MSIKRITLGWMAFSLLLTSTVVHAQTGWTNLYTFLGIGAYGPKLILDPGGNILLTGTTSDQYGDTFAAVLKYSASGTLLWTNLNELDNAIDGLAIATDTNSDALVMGYVVTDGGNGGDYVALQYSSDGAPIWTNLYTVPQSVYPSGMVADHQGDTIITGSPESFGSDGNFLTVKYSNAGAALWTNIYTVEGYDSYYTVPNAIAVDTNDDVFLTGYTGTECATLKLSSDGATLWTNLFSGEGIGMAVDHDGDVIVTTGGAAVKYSNSGLPLWTNEENFDPSSSYGAVTVDNSNNVFVLGDVPPASPPTQFGLIKYSPGGAALWTNYFSATNSARGQALATDATGNVYIAGETAYTNYLTIKYAGDGTPVWTNLFSLGGGGRYDISSGSAIAVDASGDVFVTGNAYTTNGRAYCVTISYPSISTPAPVSLGFQFLSAQLTLSWTNSAFTLQSSTNATGPYTNISSATSPFVAPLVGQQQFFRLAH